MARDRMTVSAVSGRMTVSAVSGRGRQGGEEIRVSAGDIQPRDGEENGAKATV